MNRGIVTADLLNVRSYPGAQGKVLTQLEKNALVEITDQIKGWYQIRYQQLFAYVASRYVTKSPKETHLKAEVKTSRLNVRAGPSSQYQVLGQVKQDQVFDVLDEDGNWLEIKYNGAEGFIYRKYTQLIEAASVKTGYVSVERLNVRQHPSRNALVVATLPAGTEVKVIAEFSSWYEIKHGSSTAFVAKKYISHTLEQQQEAKYFFQQAKLKEIGLIPAVLFQNASGKEQRRVSKTWNAYGQLLESIANGLDIDVGCAIAVLCVESGGEGYDANGRMIIRFENHQFWKYWGKHNSETFDKHFLFNDDQKWKGHKYRLKENDSWSRIHGNQDREWEVLELARSFNDAAALNSISMGLPQVMGFNYKAIGYRSVQQMFDKLSSEDVRYQLFAMFDFFDNRMIKALREYNFERFAKYYNGPGQAALYGEWIEDHFEAYQRLKDQ